LVFCCAIIWATKHRDIPFVPALDDRQTVARSRFWLAARNLAGLIDWASPGMLVAYQITA
jgi:hypothetical protein